MASSRRKRSGYVYFGRSVRKNGNVQEYVGSTTRDIRTRLREHKSEVRKKNSKTWVGRGSHFEITDYFWSRNPRKAERKIKNVRKASYKAGKYRSRYNGEKGKKYTSRQRTLRRYSRRKEW